METFMFNLNKKHKYKKITNECSIYCNYDHGPWTKGFGTDSGCGTIRKIRVINVINSYFKNGIDILPDINSDWKFFNVKELEVFKIIFI